MFESVGFMYMCIRVRADGSAVCAHAVAGSCCQLCSVCTAYAQFQELPPCHGPIYI